MKPCSRELLEFFLKQLFLKITLKWILRLETTLKFQRFPVIATFYKKPNTLLYDTIPVKIKEKRMR